MLWKHSEYLVCPQTANLRWATSPCISYADQRRRSSNVEVWKAGRWMWWRGTGRSGQGPRLWPTWSAGTGTFSQSVVVVSASLVPNSKRRRARGKSNTTTLLRTLRTWAGDFGIILCWPGLLTTPCVTGFPNSNRPSHQYLHSYRVG